MKNDAEGITVLSNSAGGSHVSAILCVSDEGKKTVAIKGTYLNTINNG